MSPSHPPLPFKRLTDDELLDILGSVRSDLPLAEVIKLEMQIRLADRQAKAAAESARLSGRLGRLNAALVVLAVALIALTTVQILIALDVIGR